MTRAHPSPQAAQPRTPSTEPQRQLRTRLQALRLGATCFAVLAGVACFTLLQLAHVPSTPAVIVGLVFALLARVAIISLLRDWLLRAARQSAPPSTPPQMPGTTRRRRKR